MNAPKTGFLEESPGVKSSARLTIVWSMALESILVCVVARYIVRGTPDPAVIVAASTPMAMLVTKGVVAIFQRSKGDPAEPPEAAAG